MRKVIIILAILVLLSSVGTGVVRAASYACAMQNYHPALAFQCFVETMMDLWNPLDWGDNSRTGGDADDLTG